MASREREVKEATLCKTKVQARKQGHVPECKCQGGRVQRPLD